MIAGISVGTEVSRFFRSRMSRVALVTIIFMPLLYSALYLWAFWDPFNKTSAMPIAVVNSDEGTTVDGQYLNAGDRITERLRANDGLDWRITDAADAATGVADGRYYFSVEITRDFSRNVASPSGTDPRQANIVVTYDQSGNYLSSLIGRSAMETLQNSVSGTIAGQSIDKVLIGLQTAGHGIRAAADGAARLDDGAHRLRDGAGQLHEGLGRARDGSAQLAAGIDMARDGGARLDDGVQRLVGGVRQLADGAGRISGGVDRIVGQLDIAARAHADGIAPIRQLADRLRPVPDPQIQDTVRQLDALYAQLASQGLGPAGQTVTDLHRLRDGARELATQLGDPNAEFRSGVAQLADGTGRLRAGLGQLSDGGHELDSGLVRLRDGASQLHDGTGQLVDGTGRLRSGLTEGASRVPAWDEQQRRGIATTMGAPVSLSSVYDNPAPTFGYGFAPFFTPLALFVGAIIIWMLLKPMQARALAGRLHPLRVVLASYWPALIIGVAQAVVIYLVLHFGLGLAPVHTAATIGVVAAISVCFVAVVQMLNALFGPSVGRVLSMAVLMFQLVSSGGIYPPETQPTIVQWLHPLNPMGYGITALRQALMGGMDVRFLLDIAVLSLVTVVAVAISTFAAWRDRVWTLERLHPPVRV